ncbi:MULTISPECIES: TonB-dependent receptor [Henriciella]|jgi:iron complex outermembrane recepter protein|uniref:TonB-dependent receptor n=1 Tax=Henriciella pelagia TaxID=1977912 RepID=A0ABQ1JBI4_9PROT|nr:TonB-dependent receptor [Henriciella pelagia]GGB64688.1 TonB-dependent receptor [Henriciella pelagia]
MALKNKAKTYSFSRTAFRAGLLCTAVLPMAGLAVAQEEPETIPQAVEDGEARQETIVVTGARSIIQNTIDIKRQSTTIVDGLSATDIGDLPALSIGEALESITGAASHRENGGATEISIRGLGPFLSATTFNGREATNGSGDRSVNFSQFPSELMNKLAIYKTQDASLIEGGVAGLIALETVKPLEYGKRRVQLDLKGNYNPDQQNISDSMAGDLGFRGTLSYVDQFEVDGMGDFGVSVGLQRSDISQPEQEMRSSSPSGTSLFACIADPSDPDLRGYANGSNGDCEDLGPNSSNNDGYNTSIDPATGLAVDDGLAYAWASSSRGFRQNDTRDERDSAFIALQWQPNERMDFNFDAQWSERVQSEDRHDLNFSNMKRSTEGVTLESLQFQDNGVVQFIETQSDIESNGEIFARTEEYFGYGLSGAFRATDRLVVSGDYSFSETTRDEDQVSLRVSSQGGPGSGGRENVNWMRDGDGFVTFGVVDFDVNDISNFTDGVRARIDSDVDRRNTVEAIRFDAEYDADWGMIDSLEFGVRLSELEYVNLAGTRTTVTTDDLDPNNIPCATNFAESDFLSSAADALVTQFDSSGNIVNQTSSWATFDNRCLLNYILDAEGESFSYPDQEYGNNGTTDVTETTTAFYAMANFDTMFASKPLRGNFGVRVVNTDVESLGFRNALSIITNVDGTIDLVEDSSTVERIVGGGDYTEVLPSLNVIMDLRDDVLLRGAIYRGLSRADPADMNFSRSFSTDTDDGPTTLEELITGVNASGNPNFEPLTSWNYDVAAEWYPNDDTILAVTLYAKDFTGGFENAVTQETFTIDGQQVTVPVTLLSTNEDTSSLYGLELTAAHRFQNLPEVLDGLGFKISYNLADSDFEFEDSLYGDQGFRDSNGQFVQTNVGIVAPGNIPGFSEQTFSGQVYYEKGPFDGSIIYKYRSEYFQPYTSNGTRLRYVGDVGVWEARASYRLTDNVRLSMEAINLFDAPKEQYFFTTDNLGEANYYGPRIFFGVRAKF